MLGLVALVAVLFYANVLGDEGGANVLLYFAYILAVLAILGVAGFFVYDLVKKPKQVKSVAILLVGAIVLTLICYGISTPTAMGLDPELERTTSTASIRWSETGIYGMYILFAGAFISILVGSVRNMFK